MLSSPVKTQEKANQYSRSMDYNKGMEVIHEQYNQILHMLGKTNLQGTSEANTSTQGPINDNFNSIQSSHTAGNNLKLIVGTHDWIVDSGVTNHITYKIDILLQKKSIPVNNCNKVDLPNRYATTVTHTGSCNITEHDNVKNVLVILEFKNNLLSVSKLTKDISCSVSFFYKFFVIQDLYNGKVKVIGKESNGHYFLPVSNHRKNSITHSKKNNAQVNTCSATSSMLLWHQRLGHTSPSVLAHAILFPIKHSSIEIQNCTICPLAKQHRLPFPHSTSMTSLPFISYILIFGAF